jgi:prevent-host-death family protein
MARSRSPVGVRELRARLSEYLRAVRRGETVTIGDRRRVPVARLVPVRPDPDSERLDRLVERGVLQRGRGKPGGGPRVRSRRKRQVSDLVLEDRR